MTGVAGVGPACCWRETWRETWRDRERCVWHARGEKPATALADGPPDERVDGAVLHGVDLADADWLAGRSLVAAVESLVGTLLMALLVFVLTRRVG